MTRAGWLTGLTVACVLAGGPAWSAGRQDAAAAVQPRPDPAVRHGRLANGFSYAMMHNNRPEKGASLRLMIGVGSFEEADEERGLAHFLEHMAFNGTQRFPEGDLQRRFAEAGLAFGRDQNASTTAFATVYSLDLHQADEVRLDLAFDWLGDVADGLLLAPEAVDRERGVVLAEHDGRLGPGATWRERYNVFAAPGLRGPQRLPIGTRAGIQDVTAEALGAFHQRWYRPDNAVLVVVGDIDQADIERRIEAVFGDWTAEGPPPARAAPGAPDLGRGLDVFRSTARQQSSRITLCRRQAFENWGPDSLERRRRNIERALWRSIMGRRLARRAQGETPPFSSAEMTVSSWPREAAYVCLNMTPRIDREWREAMDAAVGEVRLMELHGVTDQELSRAIRQQQEANTAAVAGADTRYSSSLAQGLLGAQPLFGLDPAGFSSPQENARLYDRIVADLTPEDVNAAFRRDWAGAEPLISIALAEPPRARAVKAAWRRASNTRPALPATVNVAEAWAYSDLGPPGEIVERQDVADPGFVRLRFANGVVANFKTAAFTKDRVSVTVRFGAGLREIAPQDAIAAQFGAPLVAAGGLGRHGLLDIGELFPTRRVGVSLSIRDDSFALSGATRPQDLEIQLQILAAYLTDPGFRPDYEAARLTRLEALYRSYQTDPAMVGTVALLDAVAPGSPRAMPSLETMKAIDQSVLRRLFSRPMATAPLEVTVVGDVDETTAVGLLAKTLGALPPRENSLRDRGDAWLLRYPEKTSPVTAEHHGDAERALAGVVWPLYVASPDRRREEHALGLLRLILADEIRNAVRETLGAAYAPSVSLSMPDHADQGSLFVSAPTSPGQADAVIIAVRKTAAQLALPGGVTLEALDAARRPVLEAARVSRQNNNWWATTMDGSYRDPQVIRDALTWEADYRDMTTLEVQAAATRWLTPEPIELRVLPKAQPVVMSKAP